MKKRRSIIAAFSAAAGERLEQPVAESPALLVSTAKPPARVPAGIIGATARTLSDIRQERDDLLAKLQHGSATRELDTAVIDPSPFPDRLGDPNDVDFSNLKKLIQDEGQKVAIQVRVHPVSPERYQIIYGHRRWRAAKELGRRIKAEIVKATDEELAVAQGIENSSRQDLTWIERALFAWRLETSGIKAKGIRAALSVDDAELARFRSVCRAVPLEIIELIGRAPRTGRPRWVDLAGILASQSGALAEIKKTLSADKVLAASSDERFRLTVASLQVSKPTEAQAVELTSPAGKTIGKLAARGGDVRISIEKTHAQAFSRFLQAEMPSLLDKFFASKGADTP